MKKLLALLLALVMVFALVACGNDDVKNDDDDDDKDPTTSTTAPVGDPTDPPIVTPTDPPIVTPTDPENQDPTQAPPVTDPPVESSLAEQIVGTWTTTVQMTGDMVQLPTFTGALEMKIDYIIRADGTGVAKMDKAAFDASVDNNYQALVDAMVQTLYQQLGGQEAAEAACQASFGMSCAEYAKVLPDTLKSTVNLPEAEGTWTLNGDQLTMSDSVVTVTINGDVMTWTGITALAAYGIETMVFQRVN